MPQISDNFNISDGNSNRQAIRVISQDAPTIAVSIWSAQGRGGDADLFTADVIVHGSTAEWVMDNFVPGMPVFVSGELVSEIDHTDQGSYLNNEILADEVSMVPQDRSNQTNANSRGRDNVQGSGQRGNQQGQRGGAPQPQRQQSGNVQGGNAPGQNQQSGQRGGNQQSGNPAPGNAPAPRDR